MKFTTKIKKSWWVILSFIPLINGLGFIYIGNKTNNTNWILEGLIYEIPWIFSILFLYDEKLCSSLMVFGWIILFISIIRSILVAKRLIKALELEEEKSGTVFDNKNTKNVSKVNSPSSTDSNIEDKKSDGSWKECCICLAGILLILGIISIL